MFSPSPFKKATQPNQSPWERHSKFLADEFRLEPQIYKVKWRLHGLSKAACVMFTQRGANTHRLPNNTGRMIFPPTYVQEDLKATVWPSWNLCEQAYVHTEVSARCIAQDKRPSRGNNDSNGMKVVHMPHTSDGSLSVKLQEWETMSDLRHSVNSVVRLCHAM